MRARAAGEGGDLILSRLMLRGCRSEAVRNRNHQPLRGARPAIKRKTEEGVERDDVSPARRAVAVVSLRLVGPIRIDLI